MVIVPLPGIVSESVKSMVVFPVWLTVNVPFWTPPWLMVIVPSPGVVIVSVSWALIVNPVASLTIFTLAPAVIVNISSVVLSEFSRNIIVPIPAPKLEPVVTSPIKS